MPSLYKSLLSLFPIHWLSWSPHCQSKATHKCILRGHKYGFAKRLFVEYSTSKSTKSDLTLLFDHIPSNDGHTVCSAMEKMSHFCRDTAPKFVMDINLTQPEMFTSCSLFGAALRDLQYATCVSSAGDECRVEVNGLKCVTVTASSAYSASSWSFRERESTALWAKFCKMKTAFTAKHIILSYIKSVTLNIRMPAKARLLMWPRQIKCVRNDHSLQEIQLKLQMEL